MVELTPEFVSTLINNGLGGLAVLMLMQVVRRLDRIVRVVNDHERRLAVLERKAGVESVTATNVLEG